MARIYRSMRETDGVRPQMGRESNCLGVRVPPNPNADVQPVEDRVRPKRGMSVSPALHDLRANHIPKRLKEGRGPEFIKQFRNATGSNNLKLWSFGEGHFYKEHLSEGLTLYPDGGQPVHHGEVGPRREMPLREYEEALEATQNDWHDCEDETKG